LTAEDSEKKPIAENWTAAMCEDRPADLTAEEIWRTYILLTRVEAAWAMKSPLLERPSSIILEKRTQTHISLCPGLHCW